MKRYELNVNSCFGQGICMPSAMIELGKKENLGGIAITDFASIDGCFDAFNAMFTDGVYRQEESSYKLIYGIRARLAEAFISEDEVLDEIGEIEPVSRYETGITILVKNDIGRNNLFKLISRCAEKKNMDYGRYLNIEEKDLLEFRDGLLVGYSCDNHVITQTDNMEDKRFADPILEMIIGIIDYIEITPYDYNPAFPWMAKEGEDCYQEYIKGLVDFAKEKNKFVVAVSGAMYAGRDKKEAWIRSLDLRKCRIGELGGYSFERDGSHEVHIRSTDVLLEQFRFLGHELSVEVVISNTSAIADSIDFLSPINRGDLLLVYSDDERDETFKKSIINKAGVRCGGEHDGNILSRLEQEYNELLFTRKIYALKQLETLGDYFLKKHIPVAVGGSGNNCLTRYALGIGNVNPLDYNLGFDMYEGRWSGNAMFDLHIPEIYRSNIEKILAEIGAVKATDIHLIPFSEDAYYCEYTVSPFTWCILPKSEECFLPIRYLRDADDKTCMFGNEDIMNDFVFINIIFSKTMNFPTLLEKINADCYIGINDPLSYDEKFRLLYKEFVDDGNLLYISEGMDKENNLWKICKPMNFVEFIKCEGLIMSVGGWESSQREYFANGTFDYSDMITCREDIPDVLSKFGVDKYVSVRIAKSIGYGSIISDEDIKTLVSCGVPNIYIDVLRHIRFLPARGACVEKAIIKLWLMFCKHKSPDGFYDTYIRSYTNEDDVLRGIISDGKKSIDISLKLLEEYGFSKNAENVLRCAKEMYNQGFIYKGGSVCYAEGV